MVHTRRTIGRLPLDEFVSAIHAIYAEHDKNRSVWDVWSHANHHAAGIAAEVRRGGTNKQLITEIADFSVWLFTMINKLRGKVGEKKSKESAQESLIRISVGASNLLWNRYPGICPSCLCYRKTTKVTKNKLSKPCDCHRREFKKTRERDTRNERDLLLSNFAHESRKKRPNSIDEWETTFMLIYSSELKRLELPQLVLHLLEEVGEVSDALVRTYSFVEKDFNGPEVKWRTTRLENALADVFSLLFGLVCKLNIDILRSKRLSQIVWKRYGSDKCKSFICRICEEPTCKCKIILVPATRKAEELIRLHRT